MADDGANWAYEEASDSEKLQIAQRYLQSSPPGQIHEVLRDVAKLCPSNVLTDDAVHDALRSYNLEQFLPVTAPDADYKVLICKDGEVDATHYADPIGKRLLTFDHISQKFDPADVNENPSSFDTQHEDARMTVQKALQSYLEFEYMHEGTAGVYIRDSTLVINVCTERVNLRNFWSGRWKSTWELDLNAPSVLNGTINLHVHYFENGNLQLKDVKQVSEDVSFNSTEEMGDAVVRAMKTAEDNLQTHLEDMYINMSQETFKEMRRVMPITRMKMEWSLNAHRTAKDLGRK